LRDLGLYYFNARWYDPGLGRFITEDPVKDGSNWFSYVANNPLRYTDPTGLLIEVSYGDGFENNQDTADKAYERATSYLKENSNTFSRLFSKLTESKETYTVNITRGENKYNSATNTVDWNPNLAIQDDEGLVSPAALLSHEMGHALQDDTGALDEMLDIVDSWAEGKGLDPNSEEHQKIIEDVTTLTVEKNLLKYAETPINEELIEPTRDDYREWNPNTDRRVVIDPTEHTNTETGKNETFDR